MLPECQKLEDWPPNSTVCSICTASDAKDASAVTIQNTSATAVLQRALVHHVTRKPSSLTDLLPSLNDYFSNTKEVASKKSNMVPANNEVLSFIWQTLGKSWHDIPFEYNALPCEITIADTDCTDHDIENSSGNIVRYICDMCKTLLKSYCTFEQFCERIVFKILRLSFKPLLLIQTSNSSMSKPKNEKTVGKTSRSKSSNLGVQLHQTFIDEKVLPNKSPRKKRGRPRKKASLIAKANNELSITDPSKSICPFCHKQYSIENSFVHSCLAYRNSLRCPECNVFSSSYVRFEKHLETYHQEKKRFLCDVNNCRQRFISEPAYTWHNHFHTLEERERSNPNFNAHPIESNDLNSTDSIHESVRVRSTSRYYEIENEHGHVENQKHNSESVTGNCEPDINANDKKVQEEDIPLESAEQRFSRSKNSTSSVYLVLSGTNSVITEPRFLMSDEGLMLPTAGQWSDAQHSESYVGTEEHSNQKVMNLSFSVTDPATVQSPGLLQFDSHVSAPDGHTEDGSSLFQNVLATHHQQNSTQASDHSSECGNRNNILYEGVARNISETNVLSQQDPSTLVPLGVGSIDFQESTNCSEMLVDHICSEHRIGEQEFECPVCDQPFKSIAVLVDHLNRHSNTESCKCLICSVTVKNRSTKTKHTLSLEATDPNDLRCSLCSMKFATYNQLLEHNLCVHQHVTTHDSIIGCSSKSNFTPKSNDSFQLPGDAQPSELPCNIYSLPVSSSQFRSNDSMSGHSSSKSPSIAGSFLQNTVSLPVEGVFVPTVTCVAPGDDAYQYSQGTTVSGGAKSLAQVSVGEDALSSVPGYRTSNPVLSYHQNTSSLSYTADQTALSISGPPAGTECSEEDLGRQRLSCDSCGMLFLGHSVLASHVHSCQTFGSKLDTPFPDDNFLPATENLSVVNALEGSSGSALTPIERLIGSVDDMDYFG